MTLFVITAIITKVGNQTNYNYKGECIMEQKGSMLLKVMSIIMIVGGIIGAVGSVLMVLLAGVFTSVANETEVKLAAAEAGTSSGTVTAALWIGAIFLVASAVIEIIAGVKGKKNWNNPAAAKTLLVWGIICAVMSVIGIIISQNFRSVLTGLVVPVLYIVGAVQLKKQAQ